MYNPGLAQIIEISLTLLVILFAELLVVLILNFTKVKGMVNESKLQLNHYITTKKLLQFVTRTRQGSAVQIDKNSAHAQLT